MFAGATGCKRLTWGCMFVSYGMWGMHCGGYCACVFSGVILHDTACFNGAATFGCHGSAQYQN